MKDNGLEKLKIMRKRLKMYVLVHMMLKINLIQNVLSI